MLWAKHCENKPQDSGKAMDEHYTVVIVSFAIGMSNIWSGRETDNEYAIFKTSTVITWRSAMIISEQIRVRNLVDLTSSHKYINPLLGLPWLTGATTIIGASGLRTFFCYSHRFLSPILLAPLPGTATCGHLLVFPAGDGEVVDAAGQQENFQRRTLCRQKSFQVVFTSCLIPVSESCWNMQSVYFIVLM